MPLSIMPFVAGSVFSSIAGCMPSFAATMDLEKGLKGFPSCINENCQQSSIDMKLPQWQHCTMFIQWLVKGRIDHLCDLGACLLCNDDSG